MMRALILTLAMLSPLASFAAPSLSPSGQQALAAIEARFPGSFGESGVAELALAEQALLPKLPTYKILYCGGFSAALLGTGSHSACYGGGKFYLLSLRSENPSVRIAFSASVIAMNLLEGDTASGYFQEGKLGYFAKLSDLAGEPAPRSPWGFVSHLFLKAISAGKPAAMAEAKLKLTQLN
ncbi:MAG: hypothetical protein EOP11_01515 [Proteobacteria bacterium]|nr:MAG: hypothetical protein EOP11_01515 [Pseudomonadota bacterium]